MLILGNPKYGLASHLQSIFPSAEFISRSSSGVDLTTENGIFYAADRSLKHNTTICVSALHTFWQTRLVHRIMEVWQTQKHAGYLIVLGSSADTPVKGTINPYATDKKTLRNYCRQLSMLASGPDSWGFKITYLSPGNMHTPLQDKNKPSTPKLDPAYVAKVCEWLIDQPGEINISELCLDQNISGRPNP